jgi:hypothetical protein
VITEHATAEHFARWESHARGLDAYDYLYLGN